MVRVKIERDKSGRIRSFTVKGHADFAEHGKDIVCAGVSAVTVGTVNSIEALLGTVLESSVNNGLVRATVPPLKDEELVTKVQLLLESMVVMLQSIEESYGKHIVVTDR